MRNYFDDQKCTIVTASETYQANVAVSGGKIAATETNLKNMIFTISTMPG